MNALQGKTVRQVVMALRADDHNQERLSNWLQAVQQLNAEYVLLVSEPRADRVATILGQQFNEAEKQLKGADINWTIVRTNFFTDNLLFYAKDIKSKKRLALPLSSDGSFAPIQADDAATAVCTILSDCQKHHGKVYELTGSKTKVNILASLYGLVADSCRVSLDWGGFGSSTLWHF